MSNPRREAELEALTLELHQNGHATRSREWLEEIFGNDAAKWIRIKKYLEKHNLKGDVLPSQFLFTN